MPKREEVIKVVKDRCRKMGFKNDKYSFYKDLGNAVYAILTFSYATPFGSSKGTATIVVDPTIGIRYECIENLLMRLEGIPNPYKSYTLGIPLKKIVPHNVPTLGWHFTEEANIYEVADHLFDAIETYAFPIIDDLKNFDNFYNAVLSHKYSGAIIYTNEIIPILYYLAGKKEKGWEYIVDIIQKLESEQMQAGKEELLALQSAGISIEDIPKQSRKTDPAFEAFIKNYMALE